MWVSGVLSVCEGVFVLVGGGFSACGECCVGGYGVCVCGRLVCVLGRNVFVCMYWGGSVCVLERVLMCVCVCGGGVVLVCVCVRETNIQT